MMQCITKIAIRHVVLIVLIGYTVLQLFLMSLLHKDSNSSTVGGVVDELRRPMKNKLPLLKELKKSTTTANDKKRQEQKVAVEKPITTETVETSSNSQALTCSAYGGPSDEDAAEMIYWSTTTTKEQEFESIYYTSKDDEKYLVFEPDEAGFSNVRLSFETVFALAKATGRTLVLPPKGRFSQLAAGFPKLSSYYYTDFFHINNIPIISLQTYLERMKGKLRDNNGKGNLVSPPDNGRTNWDDRVGNANNAIRADGEMLWKFVEGTMHSIDWKRDLCIVAFPVHQNSTPRAIKKAMEWVLQDDKEQHRSMQSRMAEYADNPTAVNASIVLRLREMMATRRQLCYYNEALQQEPSLFMTGHEATGSRPLLPFYSYLFFEDWRHDVLMKRFVRDHLRFSNVIQCAAARIVHAIRGRIRQQQQQQQHYDTTITNADTSFDTMHVRRSDFMGLPTYNQGIIPAEEMNFFETNRTIYIATDEKNRNFFEPMHKKYNIFFLSDFSDLLEGVDPNFYGMIEQLICARGTKFVGTFYSTFSAYINRIRGYHAQKSKLPGHDRGALNSEYMGHNNAHRDVMKKYTSLQNQLWIREWPVGWRDIDHEIMQ